jgi:hypothetical protein
VPGEARRDSWQALAIYPGIAGASHGSATYRPETSWRKTFTAKPTPIICDAGIVLG